jgi:hypothetical protein
VQGQGFTLVRAGAQNAPPVANAITGEPLAASRQGAEKTKNYLGDAWRSGRLVGLPRRGRHQWDIHLPGGSQRASRRMRQAGL